MADVKYDKGKDSYTSNFEAMSCQCESEGSFEGAGEGEASERGAAEEVSVSMAGITNLISGLLSE